MDITVILCTCNRCHCLPATLESIAVSDLPAAIEWEVLVVDNNSTDETRRVVEDFCSKHPNRFRYLFEPRPGKSYALNSGVREARGNVLAFADDDATVEPTWLRDLTAPLLQGNWSGSAGRIILQWPSSIPRWLAVEGPFARFPFPGFDQGRQAKDLTGPAFGANMAFRSSMFEKYGLFRTDLGPSPNKEIPRPGEDTEFGCRLLAGGERLRYEPTAVVYHPVTKDRINKEYFLDWWFDCGRAEIRAYGVRPGAGWHVFGVPFYLLRRLAVWTLRWITSIEPSRRFCRKVTAWQKAGEVVECYRQSRTSKKPGECNVEA